MQIREIDGERFVQVNDLAEARGVTRYAIHEAIKAGRLTGVKHFGLMFVPVEQAEAYRRNQGGRREGSGRPAKDASPTVRES